ncbi:hypothetical protein C8Q80DRAFT_755281 [Daedaleopsis nitida]|nr:hypothetical protein C8Q80DRAFT_755281 [Daedaleopsis nitida]
MALEHILQSVQSSSGSAPALTSVPSLMVKGSPQLTSTSQPFPAILGSSPSTTANIMTEDELPCSSINRRNTYGLSCTLRCPPQTVFRKRARVPACVARRLVQFYRISAREDATHHVMLCHCPTHHVVSERGYRIWIPTDESVASRRMRPSWGAAVYARAKAAVCRSKFAYFTVEIICDICDGMCWSKESQG